MRGSDVVAVAIVDALKNKIVALATDFDVAFKMAVDWLDVYDKDAQRILHSERSDLRTRGKDNAKRFYTAQAERAMFLKIYNLAEEDKTFFEDSNGILRAEDPTLAKQEEPEQAELPVDKLAYLDVFDDGGCANGHCPVK